MQLRKGRPARLTLDVGEAGLIETLVMQVAELIVADPAADVGSGEDVATGSDDELLAQIVGPVDSGEAADDPVVRRLLPDAYRDDDDAAREWRRLGRSEVRAAKSEAMQRVLADVTMEPPVTIRLDDDHLTSWLAVLTDVRLALGERIGVTEDWLEELARLDEGDPLRDAFAIYDWLSMLQESILRVAT